MCTKRLGRPVGDLLDAKDHKFYRLRLVSALILTAAFIVSYVGVAFVVIVMAALSLVTRCINLGWRTFAGVVRARVRRMAYRGSES